MEFGRIYFARALRPLALFLIALSSSVLTVAAQQTAAPAAGNASGSPAAAQPLGQAAMVSGIGDASGESASTAGVIASSADPSSSSLKLGPGDLIEVAVYNVPELATKARVGNSGDVYLPLIDYVHVADLTMEEAQALIEKRLDSGGFVRNAHVTIFLDESASQGVTVLGEVARPGIYPAIGNRKLYDIISAAGGFSQSAGRKVSIIRLHHPDGPITLNLPRNLADDLQDNIEILPGDTITVPRAPIVYVVGEVGRPSGFLVDNGSLTVLQVLALAGGTNHTAKMSGTCIIRKGPNGMISTKIPLKKMLEAKAPDLPLQADDILFVPLSGARVVAGQSLSAAISTATGLAVIAAH